MAKDSAETRKPGSGPETDKQRPDRRSDEADRRLRKAIDRPVGAPERAREEQPIGWDFGPDGLRPGVLPEEGAGPPADASEAGATDQIEDTAGDRGEERTGSIPAQAPADDGGPGAEAGPSEPGDSEAPSGAEQPAAGRGQDTEASAGAPSIDHTVGSGGSLSPDTGSTTVVDDGLGYVDGPDLGGGAPPPSPGGPQGPEGSVDGGTGEVAGPDGGGGTGGGDAGTGGGGEARPPEISGAAAGGVQEDVVFSVSGQLAASGSGGVSWSLVGDGSGPYGGFTLGPDGSWSYALDNDRAQGLKAGDTAQEIFTVKVTDANGASVTQSVTVTITGTNDVPVISGTATGMVEEDAVPSVSGVLTASDADIEDSVAWSLAGSGEGGHGTLTLGDDGHWSYALDNDAVQGLKAGETVQDLFTVTVTDTAGAMVTQVITVTVTGTNDAPVISGTETGAVQEDEALTASGTLTAADPDIADTATWAVIGPSTGSYGTLTLGDDGAWSYALDNDAAQGLRAGETAQEIFTVTVTDASGASDTQTVTVTVTGTNDAPVISGTETGFVQEDGPLTASGALSVADPDIGDSASWSLVGDAAGSYGALTLNPDGSWSYALDNNAAQGLEAGETVQEIFTVTVTDASGASDTQTVTITVTGTNDIPVISGTETGTVQEDESLTASGALSVTDPDIGDSASWSLVGDAEGSYGALTLNPDGSWSYALDNDAAQGLKAGETAQEIFTVKVTDASGASDTQTITITVTGTNDVPVISGTETGLVQEDGTLTASGTLTSTDADIGDTASWALVGSSSGSYGSLVLGDDGAWSYALDNDAAQGLKAGETAQEIFTVTVTDASGASDTQTVTITVTGTNDVPVISGAATGSVQEDGPLTASGALTVADPDIGDSASWSLVGSSDGGYGSLTLNPDGSWSYALNNDAAQGLKAGETAQEIFTVKVTDASGASDTQTVTVTVTGTNDAPVISGTETGLVQEDGTLIASGALSVTDPDIGDSASWSLVGNPDGSYGSFALNPDGSWSYALDNDAAQGLRAGETAQEIFTVKVTDASGASDTQTVTVTITGTNDTPVISGTETGAVQEDEALTASGMLTVSDADIGDTAAWAVVGSSEGQYGSLVLGDDGAWSYTLDNDAAQDLKAGETAQEIFTVTVTDEEGASDTQTITVTVSGTNDAPVISGIATGVVTEDETLTASGRLTALDPDIGDSASWSLVGDAAGSYGALTLNPDGSWSYALDNDKAQGLRAGESAQETFTVRVTDAEGASAEQTITITVSGTNDVPVISGAGTGAVQEDETLTASGTLTVADADIGDTAAWAIVGAGAGAYGSLTIDDSGAWTYTLDNDAAQGLKAGDTAQEIFTVKVTDAAGATTTQTVTVTVTGTNDVPVISGTEAGAVQEDAALTASGTLTSADADIGDTATWSVVGPSSGSYGSLVLGDDGQWSYTLDNDKAQGLKAGETAQEIFTVTVTDASGASDTQTVTVTVTGTNDAPVISGTETGSVQEDEALTASGALTSSDVDIGDTASWSMVGPSTGSYGSLVLGDDGQWSYALDNDAAQGLKAGETAQEIFTVTVTDASGASDTQTVTITVTGTNDVPVISGAATGIVQEDEVPSVSGALSSSDADIGDSASWSVVGSSDGQYGSLVLGDDGIWSYTLDNGAAQGLKAGDSAQEIFTVQVTDASGASASQTITVTVHGTNDEPVISGSATGAVGEDGVQTASGALTSADADIGDSATWSVVGEESGAYGNLTIGDDGRWSYTLDNDTAQGLKAGETAQEIFTVKVTDASGASDTQTITVTVTGTNDVPAISGAATGSVQEDGALTAGGALTVSDADIGDAASWSVVGAGAGSYGDFTLGADGHWSYALDNDKAQELKAGETAQDIFTVKVTDASGASDTQTVTITVTGTNDAPVISGTATGLVAEDGTLTAAGKLDVFDADTGDTAAWSVVGGDDGNYGSLSIDENGRWSYSLDNDKAQGLRAGETAQETFTVRVTDSEGASAEQTIIVTVNGTNDVPVISGTSTGKVREDVTLTASGTLTAADADIGDDASWSIDGSPTSEYGILTIDPESGEWTFTLDNDSAQGLKAGETIRETFTVRATDSAGASETHLVSVEIKGTNDNPHVGQALNNMGSMKEDTSVTFSAEDLLRGAQVTDIDQDNLTIISVGLDGSSAPGTLVNNGNGTWTFTPNANVSNDNAEVVFQVSDGTNSVSARASVAIQPVADPAEVSISSSALQEVIKTGPANDLGRIVAPQITTQQLKEFTLEFTVVGNSVPESTTGQGPVIVNIGSPPSDKNTLTLWDPANMKVGMSKPGGGDINIATGVDLTDGESHRVTVTWDAASNTLRIYDNGELALTTQLPKPLPSTLYMAVAEKANTPPTTSNPAGGGYRNTEHFEGTIYNVAMSNKAETAQQVKDAPLAEQMENNLLIDLRAQNDKIVDTTGRNQIKIGGAIDTDSVAVDTTLGSAPVGSIVRLDIDTELTDPNDRISHLEVSGFLAGTIVSDGVHSVVVAGPTQKIDMTDWSLDKLTADLPDGVRTSMDLTVTATTTTPPYATGEMDPQGQPVTATDSATSNEHHILLVEGAGPPPVIPADAAVPMAMAFGAEEAGLGDTAVVGAELADSAGGTPDEAPAGNQQQAKTDAPAASGGTTAAPESSAGTAGGSDTVASAGADAGADGATVTDAAQGSADETGTVAVPGAEALVAGAGSAGEGSAGTDTPITTGTQPDGSAAAPGLVESEVGSGGGETAPGTEPALAAGGADATAQATEPSAAGAQPDTSGTTVGVIPAETAEPPTAGTEPVGTASPTDGDGSEAVPPAAPEPVDASGQVTLVNVNDWYNPSWGGGYNATFQLTLTDEMLRDGGIEGWSLQVGVNNPNATVSTGWLDGFNGTVAFDPATGVFSNAGQDYQPELHAGDTIQFSVQVQNTGFNMKDFSFSFQDLDPMPEGATDAGIAGVAAATHDGDMAADSGDAATVSLSAAMEWGEQGAQASPASSHAVGDFKPQAAAAPAEVAARAETSAGEGGTQDAGHGHGVPDAHASAADSHAGFTETVDHGQDSGAVHAPEPAALHLDAAASDDAHHAVAASATSTADPYLQFVQPPAEDHAAALLPADDQASGATEYLQMAGGDEQAAQAPPPPDHLFADAQVEHGAAPGHDAQEQQQEAHQDDAAAAAAAPEPVSTEDDQSRHGH